MRKLKLFSLALMALFATSAWAGTETVTKSNNSWDGVSVNINHDECGNGSSDQKKDGDDNKVNYVKFRTNKNGNTLTLNVKSGYKVTGVSMRAYSNNKTSTIILSGVSIDGVAISPYAPIEFPGSDAGTTATYNNATLEAETSIVFSFDNSNVNPDDNDNKNSQIMAALTITYEIDCAAADATFSAESNSIEIGLGESSASTNLTFTKGDNTNDATFAVTKGGEETDKASVSAGVFTATAAGIYKVTATQEFDGTHCEVIKEVTITVTDANGPDCSAGILFKMEALKVCTCSIASKADYPLSDGENISIEGGSLVLHNVNSSTKAFMTKNQSSLIQWSYNTGDVSFNITTDCDLAAGDTIKYTTNQDGQVLYINTTKATKPASGSCDTIPADKKYYVVKAGGILEGRNSFSIWRGGSSTYIRTIEVVRPTPPCDAPAAELSLSSDAAAIVYVGDEITFSTTGGNGGTIALTGANSETITDSVWTATAGIHTFTASQAKNGDYCAQESVLEIEVLEKTPVDTVIVAGETAAFVGKVLTYAATAENATEYEWYIGEEKQGSDSAKLILTPSKGSYSIICKARNKFNVEPEWIASDALELVVSEPCGELIKATTQQEVTGTIGGTVTTTLSKGDKKKLDSGNHFGVTLTYNSFVEGDTLLIDITDAADLGKCMIYGDKDGTDLIYDEGIVYTKEAPSSTGLKKILLPAAVEGKQSLFLYRSGSTQWNVTFSYIAVKRPEPAPTPTALDNTEAGVKAVKRLENGMLVIEKNGVRYNAMGQIIR